MNVQDIMIRHVKTVTPETPIAAVAADMCLYRISGMPVLDGERLIGFVAEKDVLHRLFPSLEDSMNSMNSVDFVAMEGQYKNMMSLKVADLMSTRVLSVSPDMPILRAASVMVRHRFRRIPVADGDRLVGMLSLGDVHKALFKLAVSS